MNCLTCGGVVTDQTIPHICDRCLAAEEEREARSQKLTPGKKVHRPPPGPVGRIR